MKTIDVNCLEWFDRVNGNSYFAATVIVDYQMATEQRFILPYQYGYGDQYRYEAFETLKQAGLIPESEQSYWRYCDEAGIITRFSKRDALKRELKNLS